jgi:hypothetical protein
MGGFLKRSGLMVLAVLFVVLVFASRPAAAQVTVSSTDGTMSLKLGVLGQIQGASVQNDSATNTENDIFFRRLRLIGLFKMGDKLSVFFDTDDPNLGKGSGTTAPKAFATSMYIQDFVVTYALAHEFQIEGGEILTPNSYNHLTSAGALLPLDYGAFSFQEITPMQDNVGRDFGLDLRGYLANDHLEYRLGMFQGVRGVEDTNSFRYAGRLSLWVFGAQTGLFYRGTSLGKIQSMEFGGSFDKQKGYSMYDGDFFWDQPVGNGDGFTLQADYQKWNGGTGSDAFVTLPKQTTLLGEVGYYFGALQLQPFFQYNDDKFDSSTGLPDQKHLAFGAAYYFAGNASNVKLQYVRLQETGVVDRNEWQMQYQIFLW